MSTKRECSPSHDPYAPRLYKPQYEAAKALYEEGRIGESFKKAIENLQDDFVPPYYRIRNNLAAHAAPNWDDAAEFVYMARTTYNNMLPVIQHHQDPNDLAAMEEIRIELEDLDRYREGDLAENEGGADTDEDDISIEEYEEEVMLEDGVEEEAELAQVGNQEEVDAGTISLPICSASKDDNAAGTHVAENAGKK